MLDKLKWAYDGGRIDFSVLLGSSRILPLDRIKESLAGRVFLYELWPLTVGELAPHFGGERPATPLCARLMQAGADPVSVLKPLVGSIAGAHAGAAQGAMQHILEWGGLPQLLQYPPQERLAWLEAYQATYLERDLADLARLRDLAPFATCHRLAALRTGRILSYSELARDAGLPVTTVRRYLGYLELSYQTLLLAPWSGNDTVRLVKSPKLLWVDLGVQRALSGQLGPVTGEQYESAVIVQALMTLHSLGVRVRPSFLRTAGGFEVDLVLEGASGVWAIEIKNRPRVDRRDAAGIERAMSRFRGAFQAGLVVYRGDEVAELGKRIWSVPDWLWLGTSG